jgi:hypothetical protein
MMNEGWSRRQLLKRLVATAGSLLLPPKRLLAKSALNPGERREIQIFSISPHTFRLSILPRSSGQATKVPDDGSLIKTYWGEPVATLRGSWRPQTIRAGNLQVHASPEPLACEIATTAGKRIQRIAVDQGSGVITFETGEAPLFGLGAGGNIQRSAGHI